MATTEDAKPTLADYKKMFDDARDTEPQNARRDSILSRSYYDGDQLSATVNGVSIKAVLASRGMPEIVFNRTKAAVNGTLGVVGKNKTDPRAYMRNPPKDDAQQQPQPGLMGQASQQPMGQQAPQKPKLDAGDVASMTLRYIADTTHFASHKMDVLENILIEGCGAVIIEVDENKDVQCDQIRWEEFFYDPRSRKHDFSDARYMGIAKWKYKDDLIAQFKDKKAEIEAAIEGGDASSGSGDDTWADRPLEQKAWTDKRLGRIMSVELYYKRGGVWYDCRFCSGGILADAIPVAYVDDKKRTVCPIIAQSGYIDRKNNRYGMVRDMRGVQDEINQRRLKALHEINSRQIQQVDPNAPPIDAEKAREEAAKPDGVLPTGWNVVPRQDVVANNIEMLQLANSEIERMGPNPAILGRQGADASGRADQIRQEAGLTELWPLLGRFSDFETRCYTRMWGCAAQFWDGPRWIRTTNDDGAPQYVQINEPETVQAMDPMTGQMVTQPKIDPRTGQPAMKHHIATMDVDIVVDNVPDTANLEQEIFNELAKAAGPRGNEVPFSVLIRLSGIPKKQEVLDMLETEQAKAASANNGAQQMMMAEQQAKVAKLQAEAQETGANIQKMQAELADLVASAKLKNAQADVAEVTKVVTAMEGHLKATTAAQLPAGVTLDGSGSPAHMQPPPHPVPGDGARPGV